MPPYKKPYTYQIVSHEYEKPVIVYSGPCAEGAKDYARRQGLTLGHNADLQKAEICESF